MEVSNRDKVVSKIPDAQAVWLQDLIAGEKGPWKVMIWSNWNRPERLSKSMATEREAWRDCESRLQDVYENPQYWENICI
jgi:hypothetical protein